MTINNQITLKQKQNNRKMYSLNYQVTTSTCDSEGRLKLYSALQMMQDCSEMWIDSEPGVKQYFKEQNMAQLLASRQVEIIRVPVFKEKLTVTTSVYGMKRCLDSVTLIFMMQMENLVIVHGAWVLSWIRQRES